MRYLAVQSVFVEEKGNHVHGMGRVWNGSRAFGRGVLAWGGKAHWRGHSFASDADRLSDDCRMRPDSVASCSAGPHPAARQSVLTLGKHKPLGAEPAVKDP
ncbi:MAG TPA: hypothetical protein VNX65_00785 [Patescibacteria group bacterium]|jgi:hypothetical protein|nr:hypothetical protein [Patescibacteria group bacterium]